MILTRRVRLIVLGVALAAAGPVALVGAAWLDPQDASSALVHEWRVPLDNGRLDVGEVLGRLADEIGLDGQALRDHLAWTIDVGSAAGRLPLSALSMATRGVVGVETTEDSVTVRIDRARLRREEARLRGDVRELVERFFPASAAVAASRYGITVHRPDRSPVAVQQATIPEGARVVVLVHGMDDPGEVWNVLRPSLLAEGYWVAQFEYPNDQPVVDSAEFFAGELAALRQAGAKKIDIVGHSMGGLVAREVLTHPTNWYAGRGRGQEKYPNVDRLIMVGTPNHGSAMARLRLGGEIRDQVVRMLSGDGLLFGAIFDGAGEAKLDLLPGSEFLTRLNARPHPEGVRLSIIAAQASPVSPEEIEQLAQSWNDRFDGAASFLEANGASIEDVAAALATVVEGAGDGCVPIDSTRLEGVHDWVLVDGNHLSMIRRWTFERGDRMPPAVPIILDRLDD